MTTENSQQPSNEHLLLIRGTHWNGNLSPAQLQQVMTDFYNWANDLQNRGLVRAAQPLMESGKLVSAPGGSVMTDGIFAESKEAIAGYFALAVDSTEEAVRLAQSCPILAYGAQIEVRPVADLCRPMADLKTSGWQESLQPLANLVEPGISE